MRHPALSFSLAAVATLACGYALAQSSPWTDRGGAGPPTGSPCAAFSTISGVYPAAPGVTNGAVGVPQVGETYTLAVTGPGTGTFRMVGDAGGVVTYAGPTTVPGTLNFTFTAPPPVGAIGVGFYFDAGAGNVTVGASCSGISIPATNRWGEVTLLGLAGLIGLAALFLRRRKAT